MDDSVYTPIVSDKSVDKLNSLTFDPIARLVRLHDRIEEELYEMQYDGDGNPKRKFSQVAFCQLIATQQKISNDLLRYGYKRVPEVTEVHTTSVEPIQITLT